MTTTTLYLVADNPVGDTVQLLQANAGATQNVRFAVGTSDFDLAWTQMPAGSTLTIAPGQNAFIRYDSTGARGTLALPGVAAIAGQTVVVKFTGATSSGLNVNPGTGAEVEDLNNAGNFITPAGTAGAFGIAQPGTLFALKYDASSTPPQWVEMI